MKYYVTYDVTISHTIEIDAESAEDARSLVKMANDSDIIQDVSEKISEVDLSGADVSLSTIMNSDGDYVYDGIGIF